MRKKTHFFTKIFFYLCRARLFSPALPAFSLTHLQKIYKYIKHVDPAIICFKSLSRTESAVRTRASPLQRIALLSPRASAVPALKFSTRRCLTFFNTETHKADFSFGMRLYFTRHRMLHKLVFNKWHNSSSDLYPETSPVWGQPAACCSGSLTLPVNKNNKSITWIHLLL